MIQLVGKMALSSGGGFVDLGVICFKRKAEGETKCYDLSDFKGNQLDW